MELADVQDSKSCGSDTVSVRSRPPAPSSNLPYLTPGRSDPTKSHAGVVELADTQVSEACGSNFPYRFNSGRLHQMKTPVPFEEQGFFHFYSIILYASLLIPLLPSSKI